MEIADFPPACKLITITELSAAFNYWEATIRCPQNLLFSRLNGALQGQSREGQLFPSPCWTPLISCNPERAAGAHCWLRQSFWSTRTPKSFSAGLLSRSSSPSLYVYLGLPQPRRNTLHLTLLDLLRFTSSQTMIVTNFVKK